jgi:hypothetical protein
MQGFERSADDYPYIGHFLQRARALALVTDAQIVRLIKHPTAHGLSWPLEGSDLWPVDIALPAVVLGKVDGITDPSRAGGPPDPHNGYDAVTVYRIRSTKTQSLEAILSIEGTGRVADRQDVDMELYNINTSRIAAATSEAREERLSAQIGRGSYLLYVRDGGNGNRASFRLQVRAFEVGPRAK